MFERSCQGGLLPLSSVMSRQKLARHLSFVSPHFSTETLSLSYMPELIWTTRLLGVRCSCVVWVSFQVPVLICVGASWDMPEHVARCLCALAQACVQTTGCKQATNYKHNIFYFTYSNQSLTHTSHLQLKWELSFQVRFCANVFLCFI